MRKREPMRRPRAHFAPAAANSNFNVKAAVRQHHERLMQTNRPKLQIPPRMPPSQSAVAREKSVALEDTFPPDRAKLAAKLPTLGPVSTVPRATFGDWLLWLFTISVAVILAGVAAYLSIIGMAAIFAGSAWAAMGMEAAIEGGKLAGAAWMSRKWSDMGAVRYPLACLVAVAGLINAVGVFGQLSAAHLSPHTAAIAVTDEQQAGNQVRIEIQQNLIQSLNRQLGQIDGAIEEATKRGRTASALTLATDQRATRGELMAERLKAEGQLIALRQEAARVTGEQKRANADVGVLEYAATLFGVDRERMIQILILAMVLTCDPLSIALVVATSQRRRV